MTGDMKPLAVDTKGAAKMIGLSTTWLEQLRVRGGGPRYIKAGARVLYRIADLETWLDEKARDSTSDQ